MEYGTVSTARYALLTGHLPPLDHLLVRRHIGLNDIRCTYLREVLHSLNDEPSFIRYGGCGPRTLHESWWHCNGFRHRGGDKPAYIYCSRGIYKRSQWYRHGVKHRDGDRPATAKSRIHAEGWTTSPELKWFRYGRKHRDYERPSQIHTCTGTMEWHTDNSICRGGDKPASILKSVEACPRIEWYKDGRTHRDGGRPAILRGNPPQLTYALNGYVMNAFQWRYSETETDVVCRTVTCLSSVL